MTYNEPIETRLYATLQGAMATYDNLARRYHAAAANPLRSPHKEHENPERVKPNWREVEIAKDNLFSAMLAWHKHVDIAQL